MRFSLVREDSQVTINGITLILDLSNLDGTIRSVYFRADSGYIETMDRKNTAITDLIRFEDIIAAHAAVVADMTARSTDPYYDLDPAAKLSLLKHDAFARIESEKSRSKNSGVLVEGILFDSDAAARLAYMEFGLQLAANPLHTVPDFRASFGVWVVMKSVLYGKVMAVLQALTTEVYNWQHRKFNEINTAATLEELDAVKLNFKSLLIP